MSPFSFIVIRNIIMLHKDMRLAINIIKTHVDRKATVYRGAIRYKLREANGNKRKMTFTAQQCSTLVNELYGE